MSDVVIDAGGVGEVVTAACEVLSLVAKTLTTGGVSFSFEKMGGTQEKDETIRLSGTDTNQKPIFLECTPIPLDAGKMVLEGHFMFSQRTQNLGRLLIPCTRVAGRVYFKIHAKKIALQAEEDHWTSFRAAMIGTTANAVPTKFKAFQDAPKDQRIALATDPTNKQLWALSAPIINWGSGQAKDRDGKTVLLNSQNPYQALSDEELKVKLILEYDDTNPSLKALLEFAFPRVVRGLWAFPILSRTEPVFSINMVDTPAVTDLTAGSTSKHVGLEAGFDFA